MPLTTDLDNLMTAIAAQATTLAPAADPKQLVILAKAAEAMRGTVALQAVIEASGTAQTAISGAQVSALAALAAALDAAETTMDDKEAEIIAALDLIKTTYTSDMLTLLNSSGNYRIGDMWLALFPDATNLPGNVWALDGSLKPTADCPNLIATWGLGGSVCPFVTNYNATNPYGITVGIVGANVRLPNLTGGFLRGRNVADTGLYQLDEVKSHSHGGADGSSYLVKGASGAEGGFTTGSSKQPLQEKTVTALEGGAESRPVNYAGLWVVRYK